MHMIQPILRVGPLFALGQLIDDHSYQFCQIVRL